MNRAMTKELDVELMKKIFIPGPIKCGGEVQDKLYEEQKKKIGKSICSGRDSNSDHLLALVEGKYSTPEPPELVNSAYFKELNSKQSLLTKPVHGGVWWGKLGSD